MCLAFEVVYLVFGIVYISYVCIWYFWVCVFGIWGVCILSIEDDKVANMLVDTEVDNVVDKVANMVGYQLEGYHLEFGPGRSLDI